LGGGLVDRGQAKGFEGGGEAQTEELHEKHRAEFASIDDALVAMARGEFVVVLDDEDRENEGDLIIAADKMTPEAMGFMVSASLSYAPRPRFSVNWYCMGSSILERRVTGVQGFESFGGRPLLEHHSTSACVTATCFPRHTFSATVS